MSLNNYQEQQSYDWYWAILCVTVHGVGGRRGLQNRSPFPDRTEKSYLPARLPALLWDNFYRDVSSHPSSI